MIEATINRNANHEAGSYGGKVASGSGKRCRLDVRAKNTCLLINKINRICTDVYTENMMLPICNDYLIGMSKYQSSDEL